MMLVDLSVESGGPSSRGDSGCPEDRREMTFAELPGPGLTQDQFWRDDFKATYGDGTAVDCLSVDVSNWDTPGILYGKPANRCTAEEVKNEVWAQIKAHLNDTGTVVSDD